MSDSVVKLRIDSKEYDANIKRAGQALTDYFNKVKEGGGTLMYLDEGVMEAVKAMGELGTQSNNTKGALRELTQATADMTVAYRSLTDEEKNSPLGAAMAESIQQMTERAGEMRDAMDDVQASIQNAASDTRTFDQIAQGMSVATAGFQGLTGAGKLLGIEMGNDVEIIAKLQAAMAVTNSLTTIQTALQKQSALMQGVQAVQTAAAAAAQTSFAGATSLATAAQSAFNAVANANPYLLLASTIGAVVGAIGLFSSSTEKATDNVEEQSKKVDELGNALDRLKWKYDNIISVQESLGKSYDDIKIKQLDLDKSQYAKQFSDALAAGDMDAADAARKKMEEIGRQILDIKRKKEDAAKVTQWFIDEKDFINTRKEINAAISHFKRLQDEVGIGSKKFQEYQKYIDEYTAKLPKSGSGRAGSGNGSTGKPEIQFADDSIMAQEKLVQDLTQKWKSASGELRDGYLKDLNDAQAKLSEMTGKGTNTSTPEMAVGLSGFNEQTINAWVSMIKSDLASADIGSEVYNSLMDNLSDMSRLTTTVQDAVKLGLEIPQDVVQSMFETVFDQGNLPEDMYNDMIQKFIEDFKKQTGQDLKIGTNGGLSGGKPNDNKNGEVSITQQLGSVLGGVNSIVSGLNALGMEIPEEFSKIITGMQTVISITSSIASIVAAIQVISTANMFKFAGGGIVPHAAGGFTVPGTHFSGDVTPILANAGEVVLTKAQAGVVADALEGGPAEPVGAQPYVEGDKIFLGINNRLRSHGQGEIVTTSMLRRYGLIG